MDPTKKTLVPAPLDVRRSEGQERPAVLTQIMPMEQLIGCSRDLTAYSKMLKYHVADVPELSMDLCEKYMIRSGHSVLLSRHLIRIAVEWLGDKYYSFFWPTWYHENSEVDKHIQALGLTVETKEELGQHCMFLANKLWYLMDRVRAKWAQSVDMYLEPGLMAKYDEVVKPFFCEIPLLDRNIAQDLDSQRILMGKLRAALAEQGLENVLLTNTDRLILLRDSSMFCVHLALCIEKRMEQLGLLSPASWPEPTMGRPDMRR